MRATEHFINTAELFDLAVKNIKRVSPDIEDESVLEAETHLRSLHFQLGNLIRLFKDGDL